ncbi:MAG: sialate O-acetylesterase, partial [Janthinobacterium lividum]
MTSPNLIRRMALPTLLIATFAALNLSPAPAEAPKPFLSPLFTDNMVLQRGMADPVWGWAAPGQSVTVTLNGKTATAAAGADGKWTAKIGPFTAGGPYTLSVAGPHTVTLQNVMIGDVWLCSGQSNMEFGVGNLINPDQTIAAANDPNIRLFTVSKTTSESPLAVTSGQWQACTPDTIKSQGTWSGFSAVAYFFGKNLEQNVHVPIGLLLSSWGGTPAEAWTSEAALRRNVPDFVPQLDQLDAARTSTGSLDQRLANWYTKNDPGTPADWQNPTVDDSAWKKIPTPGLFQDAGIPELAGFNGVIWFRRTFDLPATDTGKAAVLHLMADDNETTWVNGTQVGATAGYNVPRAYPVAATLLKPTGNVVAVRVLDTGGKGGIWGDPSGLSLEVPGGENLPLAGPWHYHIGVPLTQATPVPASLDNNPNFPTALYDGMISPLESFGIKGALWYQGEANAGNAAQYRKLLPAMIGDWRQHWGEGNFPFLIVQLA